MPTNPESRRVQTLDLDHEVRHVLEEARMIVPGVQALLGFQLMSVFSNLFFSKLGRADHLVHLAAIGGTVVAMGFVMGPAAYHREAERGFISGLLVHIGTRCLQAALFALALSIAFDGYLVTFVIIENRLGAILVGAGIELGLLVLWFAYPFLARRGRRE